MKCCCCHNTNGTSVTLRMPNSHGRIIFMHMCNTCLKQFDFRKGYTDCTYCNEKTESIFLLNDMKIKLCKSCEEYLIYYSLGRKPPEMIWTDLDDLQLDDE